MGLLSWLRRAPVAGETAAHGPVAGIDGVSGIDLTDPYLAQFLRDGTISAAGIDVSVEKAMRNPAVFRSVCLISNAIGMLPLHLIEKGTKEKATDHPVFRVLHRRPNQFQTAFDFRALMQLWALTEGDGYARILRGPDIRNRGNKRIVGLLPLDPCRVQAQIAGDWTVSYRYQPKDGAEERLRAEDVFHLRGVSRNGINGISLVRQSADSIGLAIAAELALSRLYRNGSFINGYLKHPTKLSETALGRIRRGWAGFSSADKAGTTPIFEEGLEYVPIGTNAKDAQSNETRARQVEEIARIFGVPRPLLMVDETSWGSGIEALGRFFVTFGLGHWFEAWQQACERSLLTDAEVDRYEVKFNAGALLRGSVADQAEFFAKALGAGGHAPWMNQQEVREAFDLPPNVTLPPAPGQQSSQMGHNGGPPLTDQTNDNAA